MARRGNLFVISGPSGAGKGTLVSRAVQRVPDAWVSVSATTRAPREGERDGVHYHFLTPEQFNGIIEQNGFLEWANVHADLYGTPIDAVLEHMRKGDQVILEIDVQGALHVKERMPEAHLVFIDVPSLEALEARLRGRGTETNDVIAARMQVAQVELTFKERYDYTVVNDDLDVATDQLVSYIEDLASEPEGIS